MFGQWLITKYGENMRSDNANFWLRLLASALDGQLFSIPSVLILAYVASSSNLPELGTRLVIFAAIVFALFSLLFLYTTLTTYYWGGTFGKLLTGLRVTGENGKPLSFKRLFFRQTVGYQFSSILFFLGFLSVLKDPNKQGWHDKAVGSRVIVVKNLWPIALATFLILVTIHGIVGVSSITKFFNGKLYEKQIQPSFDNLEEMPITITPSPDPRDLPEDVIF